MGFYPYANLFKQIEFVTFKSKKFIFFNDLADNLSATNSEDVKTFKKISNGNAMVFATNKQSSIKSSLFDIQEQIYCDFSSATFNENTGRFSVIAYKGNKVFISYLNLK